jgi:FtsH-binding integral membrane protein
MQPNLSYGSSGSYRTASQDRTRSLFGPTMGLVAITAGCFTLGAYLGRNLSYGAGIAAYIAAFVCLLVMNFTVRRSATASVLGRVSFIALLVLIVFGIVLTFVHIPHGSLIYSILGLLIFAGLTTVDFQRLRRRPDLDSAPLIAASIFLDALNVFLFFLRIFGRGTG